MSDPGVAGERDRPAPPEDPDSVAAAEEVALRILRGAAQSAGALQRRLCRRGFSEEAATTATAAMVRYGYVDDVALATSLAARSQRSGHGHIRVAAQLRARGIDDNAVAATLAVVDPDAERAAALALGSRLWGRVTNGQLAQVRRRRVFGQLRSRGFDVETVHWVLRQLDTRNPTNHPD
ncbi:MAG: RecX family transcriptional regulator [Candidatus Dormibacteraeota bacterium]|uniref:Regulatory protein RecX n=1 Tax=Candidatus Aeolococcus gillhamiae TaxID=3127015 RepID=A0A934N6M2_9BACT|nr:RecX family transcriptional regulator [Candidatus Dormibacteraeota bacterium]